MRPPTDFRVLGGLLALLPLSTVAENYRDLLQCPEKLDLALLSAIDDKARASLDDCLSAGEVIGQMIMDARDAGHEVETTMRLDGAIRTIWAALLIAEQARSISLTELAKRAGCLQ